MKNAFRMLALSAASTLALAGAALADPPRQATVGQTISGALTPADARRSDNSLYEDYTVTLQAGQGIEALMSTGAFDAYLHLGRGTGNAFEELKSDDDSGGGEKGTDARIRFRAQDAGAYTIRASALNGDMSGAFTLALKSYTPPPAAVPKPISYGAPVSGRLNDGGSRLEEGDRLYDEYTFTAAAGDRVKIETTSGDFDSLIDFGRVKNGEFESIKSDDDSGGDKNARLLAVLEEPVEYTVRVIGFDKDARGAYTVALSKLPPPAPAPRPKPVRVNLVTKGSFSDSSPTFDEFRPYDYYTLSGRAGQEVTIIMRAPFDAFLDVGVMSAGGFAVLKSDDDGGGETNAKVDFKFERAGTVVIRTSALRGGSVGDYSLTVE